MHICHVNLASGFSGGESQTLLLIKQQLKEGYQLTVVTNPLSPLTAKLKELDAPLLTLITVKHFILGHQKSITKSCKLIHVHEGRAIYWACLQSLLFNIPYIITRRIDNPLKRKWLSNKAYMRASALVGLSGAIVDQLKRAYPNACLHKIPSSPVAYPVQSKKVEAIREQFANKFLVMQASNLLAHKGHDTTIKAAELLQEMESNIHFLILGEGPLRGFIEEKIKTLTNITLVGKQSDMGNWFAASDLFIHPSYSEGLGSVILEAMNAGLIVIGSRAGGIPDIIEHEKSGLLFDAGNAFQLVDAINQVISNAALRDRLSKGGNLEKFNIVYTASLYKGIYSAVEVN